MNTPCIEDQLSIQSLRNRPNILFSLSTKDPTWVNVNIILSKNSFGKKLM